MPLDEAKEDLVGYVDSLKNLQDKLIIGSTLSACKPIDSLICVPNFPRDVGIIEEFFFNKFCEKMKEALSNSSYVMELNSFDMNRLSKKFLELLNKHIKNTFSLEQYAKKQKLFSVIVLESDQDLEPKMAYTCYEDRWPLELVFKRYKNDEYLDHT